MNMLISTTFTIANKQITENLGLVRGNTIKAKHVGRDITAGLKNLVGGEIGSYTKALNEARDTAIQRMIEEAQKLNADAIVGVRFTTSQMMGSAAELMVYGTAVKLKS